MSNWKRLERQSMVGLGTSRNPNNGTHQTDGDLPSFGIEHKARQDMPKWFTDAMEQAARSIKAGQTPLVIFAHHPGRGVRVKRYVVMRFEDFVEWHGDVPKEGDA